MHLYLKCLACINWKCRKKETETDNIWGGGQGKFYKEAAIKALIFCPLKEHRSNNALYDRRGETSRI